MDNTVKKLELLKWEREGRTLKVYGSTVYVVYSTGKEVFLTDLKESN